MDVQSLSSSLCSLYTVKGVSGGAFLVGTPLRYDDGDHIQVFLSRRAGSFIVDDNGEAATRLMFDGIDPGQGRIQSWVDSLGTISGVLWDAEEEKLYCETNDESELPEAIIKVAEASAQMQAMNALRVQRSVSDFKEQVVEILRSVEKETGIEARYDIPVDPDQQLYADALFLSRTPISVIVAATRERLMEAELIWSTARMRQDPMKVIAVIEDASKIGLKQYTRANYFTDKTVEYKGHTANFASMLAAQIRTN